MYYLVRYVSLRSLLSFFHAHNLIMGDYTLWPAKIEPLANRPATFVPLSFWPREKGCFFAVLLGKSRYFSAAMIGMQIVCGQGAIGTSLAGNLV